MMGKTISLAMALAGLSDPALAAMTLSSADIAPGATIPQPHIYPRCGGQNVSPQLAWSGQPAGTRSLVLTMIDLDVKPALWSHWIVVDLPPSLQGLPRGVKPLPSPARAIAGNFGDAAYDGPCPPRGSGVHRYRFTLWAMPTATTAIAPDANAGAVAADLARRAIGSASFVGVVKG
ncbi:MAG TPA: YbhB/YbcL family Raf kinase inhibitor-like protein [Caulobacteraceae bacterium]|nr:YbhB/YbcL family Raf kinase inhibitor-like protein [Caulobacteraceae bacterium]